jgi:bifunctional DNA-binding transcriptional regulator/antitoxin component of YhaV-PrlF toxin-antitoxin module
MPLTESVSFKAVLQRGNRVQVPKLLRWRYKLERDQVLRVSVTTQSLYGWETFYGRMDKSGRITIPKLTLRLLRIRANKQNLIGTIMEVTLAPA